MGTRKTNRMLILISAAICGLMAGTCMMWSIFRNPLMELNNWSASQVTLAYSLFMMLVLAGNFLGGPLQRSMKPSILIFIAGLLQGLGFFLTGFAKTTTQLYLFYSIIAGIGNGLIYNTAVTTATKWFPDKKGWANGICISGMGLAPMFFAPLGTWLINHFDVGTSFRINGSIIMIAVLIFSWFIKAPEEGWKPEGWVPEKKNNVISVGKDMKPSEMLRTPAFYTMWFMTLCAVCAGVMMTGQASAIAQEVADITASQASLQVALLALASCIGRFSFGALSDKLGRFNTYILLLSLTAIDMLFFFNIADNFTSFMIAMFVVGMGYGGLMAILPGIVSDSYGSKYFSINYTLVYSGYTVASFIGPLMASYVVDTTGTYSQAFIIAGIISIGGIVTTLATGYLTRKVKMN